jgi:hypothetical protein
MSKNPSDKHRMKRPQPLDLNLVRAFLLGSRKLSFLLGNQETGGVQLKSVLLVHAGSLP